jgi:hypothetical protein
MENAKGTVMTGLKAGEYILKHRGESKFWIPYTLLIQQSLIIPPLVFEDPSHKLREE